jgi:hypothetical protein
MNPKALLVPCLILALFGLNRGCDSAPEFLPGLEGRMVGYLYSFDEFGTLLEDHRGFRVTALGHAGSYQAISDAKGRFEFVDLPTGTYELHFEKEGFGTLKQFGVQHLGGKATILLMDHYGEPQYYFLYEMAKTRIQHLQIDQDTLKAAFLFSDENLHEHVCIKLYFSTEAGFNVLEAPYSLEETLTLWEGTYSEKLVFRDHPFTQGETIYYKAGVFTRPRYYQQGMYLNILYGPDRYYDYESDQTILPNLGEISEQYSFVFQE